MTAAKLAAALAAAGMLAAVLSGCSAAVDGRAVPAPVPEHPVTPGVFISTWEVEPCVDV